MKTFRLAALVVLFTPLFAYAQEGKGKESPDAKLEKIEIALAQAHVRLAELNLQQALDTNKRLGVKAYSTQYIEKLMAHVEIDKAELKHVMAGGKVDPHDICIRRAKANLHLAEHDVAAYSEIYKAKPTPENSVLVERAKVAVEIAKYELQRTENIKDMGHTDAMLLHLQWQINALRHQVLELQAGAKGGGN